KLIQKGFREPHAQAVFAAGERGARLFAESFLPLLLRELFRTGVLDDYAAPEAEAMPPHLAKAPLALRCSVLAAVSLMEKHSLRILYSLIHAKA
ncbi:MAG: hypothetical protein NZ989_09260, partial [Bacteroidia bacterium]|nr:hypothetical protein [Bacteroidia bacterium]